MSRTPRIGVSAVRLVALAVVALVTVGCGGLPTATPAVSSRAPEGTAGATFPAPTAEQTPPPGPTPTPEPTPTLPAIIDRSLLAILPDEVAGSPVTEDVDGEREFGAGPGRSVRRYAAAVVGDAGENIASVSIAAVDPADMATFFPAWRADYDAAVCASNDGVGTTATTTVGGRTVESTTCTGGLQLFHLRLRGDSLLVSIMSIGPGKFGAKLIEGLRD